MELLHLFQVTASVLAAFTSALLGFMFHSSSLTNSQPFTKAFLRALSLISVLKAAEVFASAYRSWRIVPDAIPLDALVVGLSGRLLEAGGYAFLVWFLMRPETKVALNGGHEADILNKPSGERSTRDWEDSIRRIVREELRRWTPPQ